MATTDLLLTKLFRPNVPPRLVRRPTLNQRLHEGLQNGRQLTLISAPAGFGKTTFISSWIDTLEMPVSWLSLDAADDDPGRFFTYLVAALQKIDAQLGSEIAGVLRAGQLPPHDVISTTLVNDIVESGRRFVLVLDDFQVIQDKTILQILQTFVANLPRPLHLIILTREEPALPLARLRANNQLTEIRAADLRFGAANTAVFLNEIMRLKLSQADINTLENKTEGWVVGLQLAGLSIRDRTDPSKFIAELSGSHRHILSYLIEEVLSGQDPDVQNFLLQTSILDKLRGDLCDALTGGSNGRLLLEQLYNGNLFLIPLDDAQQWYRYHHLFADLLRDRQHALHGSETPLLHKRASQWFANAGLFREAIQHALDAQDYETAVTLIETHAMDLLLAWHAKTIKKWMRQIPEKWAAKSPKTNLMFAWMYLMSNNVSQALPYIDHLQKMFDANQLDETEPSIKAEWLALQANLLSAQGKLEESLAIAQRGLAIVPLGNDYVRSLIYSGLAVTYIQLNDRERAIEAYQMLIQHGRLSGNLVSELMGISGLGLFAMERGELRYAFKLASQGIETVERSGITPPISAAVYGELGAIYYQWYQLEKAETFLVRSAQVSKLSGFSDAEVYYHVFLSRMVQLKGDLDTGAQEIELAAKAKRVEAPTVVQEELIAQQVRIALARNTQESAEAILNPFGFLFQPKLTIPPLPAERLLNRSTGLLYNSALRIILHRAQAANVSAGLQLANQLLSEAQKSQLVPIEIETLLIRSQLLAALGDNAASRADVLAALTLAEPEGAITLFLEEGFFIVNVLANLDNLEGRLQAFRHTILATAPAHLQPSAPIATNETLVEPLSRRELELLQLIDKGHTNQEIAEALVISLHTVKKHSSNIYAKLGVRSRTQAVARARELQLL